MKKCIENDDGLGFLDVIGAIERIKSPTYSTSRLVDSSWKADGSSLLAQLDKRVVVSILDGTIAQRYKTTLMFRTLIRKSLRSPNREHDPIVYINCIADSDGLGLSYSDYQAYLDALEFVAGLPSPHNHTPNF